jgi:hypothetical protein
LDRFRATLWLCFAGIIIWVAVVTRHGAPWGQTVAIASFAVFPVLLVFKHRFLRVSVTRSADAVVCRWIPWYDSNFYLFLLLLVAGAAGWSSGGTLRVLGALFLVLALLSIYFAIPMWRKAVLAIGPSTVTLQLPKRGSTRTEIPRDRIESIEPKTAYVGGISSNAILFLPTLPGGRNAMNALQVEIIYKPADSDGARTTVLIGMPAKRNGMQVCVKSANLLEALQFWKHAVDADPNELLDQVEGMLRGERRPTDASSPYYGYFSS